MTPVNRKHKVEAEMRRGHVALDECLTLLAASNPGGAVTRAYYACYHAACALLASRGILARTHRGVHELLLKEFGSTGVFPPHLVAALARAGGLRNAADYDVDAVITMDHARAQAAVAQVFLDQAARVLAANPPESSG